MMLIPCPHCGPRNVTEFSYGGDARVRRPANPQAVSDAEWEDYLFLRDNPCGVHDELWQHVGGCRRWIAVRRDTLTHQIVTAADPGRLPT